VSGPVDCSHLAVGLAGERSVSRVCVVGLTSIKVPWPARRTTEKAPTSGANR
jgi:hypothetical protein